MADTIKIGTRIPQGVLLRIGEIFKGAEGEEMVREIAMHHIPGSGDHLGYAPGNVHQRDAFVPYAEIPADHWRQWCEMNAGSDLLTSGAVFEHDGREAPEPAPLPAVEPRPAGPVGVHGGDIADDPALAGLDDRRASPESTDGLRSAELRPEDREPTPVKPAEQMSEAELEHATRP